MRAIRREIREQVETGCGEVLARGVEAVNGVLLVTGGRIPSLDGVRAIAIALVCVSHVSGTGALATSHFSSFGNLGVRVFFVLSGFLISTLLLRELDRTGRVSLAEFYWRRTLRIFPPFYAFLGALAILQALGVLQLSAGDLWHGTTYTSNFQEHRSWWTGHLWSLAVEEQFYLLWPLALWWGGRRAAWVAALATVGLSPLWRIASGAYLPSSPGGEWFPAVADALATGCLLALWKGRVPGLACVGAAAAVLGCNTVQYYVGGPSAAGMQAGINLGIAVLLAGAVQYAESAPGRLLNAKPVAFLGKVSYSVYLWQQLFLSPPSAHGFWHYGPGLGMAATLAAALASFYLIEKPVLRWRSSRESRVVEKPINQVWETSLS